MTTGKEKKSELPKLYTVEQAASYLKLSVRTIRNKISKHELGSTLIGGRVVIEEKHILEYMTKYGIERPAH